MSEFKVEVVTKTVSAKVSEDIHSKFKQLAKVNGTAMSKLLFGWVNGYVDANWDDSVPERLAEMEAAKLAEKAEKEAAKAAAKAAKTAEAASE